MWKPVATNSREDYTFFYKIIDFFFMTFQPPAYFLDLRNDIV